jgi:hypothetical protein
MKQDKRAVPSAWLPIFVVSIAGFLLAASSASATTIEPQGPYSGTSGTPLTVSADLGGIVSPLATTITFRVYGPQDAECAAPPAATSVVAANDPGIYTSGPFTLTAAGTYRYTASYQSDGANPSASTSCADPRAAIVVSDAPPVDTNPPDTRITSHPKKKLKIRSPKRKAKATFGFDSTEAGSTFECRIDAKPFARCASPGKYKLRKGKHTFEVVATDAAGNRDATPARFKVKVVRKG